MADDDRSRLHHIIDELADDEVPIARQLLELLARGLAAPRAATTGPGNGQDHRAASNEDMDDDDDDGDGAGNDPLSSPAMLAKLAQLTDAELLRLDELLETDREAAHQFWRDRFGEEMEDDTGT